MRFIDITMNTQVESFFVGILKEENRGVGKLNYITALTAMKPGNALTVPAKLLKN